MDHVGAPCSSNRSSSPALPSHSLKRAEPVGGAAAGTRGSQDQYRPISWTSQMSPVTFCLRTRPNILALWRLSQPFSLPHPINVSQRNLFYWISYYVSMGLLFTHLCVCILFCCLSPFLTPHLFLYLSLMLLYSSAYYLSLFNFLHLNFFIPTVCVFHLIRLSDPPTSWHFTS